MPLIHDSGSIPGSRPPSCKAGARVQLRTLSHSTPVFSLRELLVGDVAVCSPGPPNSDQLAQRLPGVQSDRPSVFQGHLFDDVVNTV